MALKVTCLDTGMNRVFLGAFLGITGMLSYFDRLYDSV